VEKNRDSGKNIYSGKNSEKKYIDIVGKNSDIGKNIEIVKKI